MVSLRGTAPPGHLPASEGLTIYLRDRPNCVTDDLLERTR